MKQVSAFFAIALVAIVALVLVVFPQNSAEADTPTSGVGGQLSIGATSLLSGSVIVPIDTTATTDAYGGFSVNLKWTVSAFAYGGLDSSGSVLAGHSPLCLAAAQPSGEIISCSATDSSAFTTAGNLVKYKLTPIGPPSCTILHLNTLNAPDNGDSTTGSYTINYDDQSPQANTYGTDLAVNQAGAPCVPVGSPTNTPTPTNTLTPTATFTPSMTPTSTATSVSGVPDVIVTLFASPSFGDSGTNVAYSALIRNLGNVPATSVSLRITLPSGGVLLGPGICYIYVAPSSVCQVGTLAANDSAPGGPDETVVPISARLPYATGNTNAVFQALVAAANEPIANQGNNSASIAVFVRGCPDLNADGQVNGLDLNKLALAFGSQTGDGNFNPLADFNADGKIDGLDLAAMAPRYLESCAGLDSDHDGISDHEEISLYLTCPGLQPSYQSLPQCHLDGNLLNPLVADPADTDADGLPDGVDVFTYGSNPLKVDTDLDFYGDGQEAGLGKNPVIYCAIMAADINTDAFVNGLDLNKMAMTFFKVSGDPGFDARSDINRDGQVNGLDLNRLAIAFGHSIVECP